jgi:hypothetical protein
MKKFIKVLILTLFLFTLTSCNKYITTTLYDVNYSSEELAISDIYKQLYTYEMDSIPLDQWMSNYMHMGGDTLTIYQRMLRKVVNEKTNYSFVYTEYLWPSGTKYSFVIRYRGKKK